MDAIAGLPAALQDGAQSELDAALAGREEALRVIRAFLDAPGIDGAKRIVALKLLTGRVKAQIATLPEGREVLLALAFDAVLQGGASGGQLKALALLLNAGKNSTTTPSKRRMTLQNGERKITVEDGGEEDED